MATSEKAVKRFVRIRDGNKCVHCGRSAEDHQRATGMTLSVHRKTPGSPYSIIDCETVCGSCHRKAHKKLNAAKVCSAPFCCNVCRAYAEFGFKSLRLCVRIARIRGWFINKHLDAHVCPACVKRIKAM